MARPYTRQCGKSVLTTTAEAAKRRRSKKVSQYEKTLLRNLCVLEKIIPRAVTQRKMPLVHDLKFVAEVLPFRY